MPRPGPLRFASIFSPVDQFHDQSEMCFEPPSDCIGDRVCTGCARTDTGFVTARGFRWPWVVPSQPPSIRGGCRIGGEPRFSARSFFDVVFRALLFVFRALLKGFQAVYAAVALPPPLPRRSCRPAPVAGAAAAVAVNVPLPLPPPLSPLPLSPLARGTPRCGPWTGSGLGSTGSDLHCGRGRYRGHVVAVVVAFVVVVVVVIVAVVVVVVLVVDVIVAVVR